MKKIVFKYFSRIAFYASALSCALFLCACASDAGVASVSIVEKGAAFSDVADNSQIRLEAKKLFIIAMPEESRYIISRFGLRKITESISANDDGIVAVTTGVGGEKVTEMLSQISVTGDIAVYNVGYCGSNNIKRGDVVKVGEVAKIETPHNSTKISDDGVKCCTADAFVLQTDIETPCVFDMELEYVRRFFPNVISYKIVSDNLNRAEYENFNSDIAWEKALDFVK